MLGTVLQRAKKPESNREFPRERVRLFRFSFPRKASRQPINGTPAVKTNSGDPGTGIFAVARCIKIQRDNRSAATTLVDE